MRNSPLAEKMMTHDLSEAKIILDIYGFKLERFANKYTDKKFYFINDKKAGTFGNKVYVKGSFLDMYKNFINKVDLVYVENLDKNYKQFLNALYNVLKPGGKAYIEFELFGFPEMKSKLRIYPQDFVNEIIKYFAVIDVFIKRKGRNFYAIFYLEKL